MHINNTLIRRDKYSHSYISTKLVPDRFTVFKLKGG